MARGWLVESVDDSQQCALSTTRGTDDAEELFGNVEAYVIEDGRRLFLGGVRFDDVLDLQERCAGLGQIRLRLELVFFALPQ